MIEVFIICICYLCNLCSCIIFWWLPKEIWILNLESSISNLESSISIFVVHQFLKNFAGINFGESPILKVSRVLIFVNQHFWGAEKEFDFTNLGYNSRNSRDFPPAKISSLKVEKTFVMKICILQKNYKSIN